jgi:hypothetical protein
MISLSLSLYIYIYIYRVVLMPTRATVSVWLPATGFCYWSCVCNCNNVCRSRAELLNSLSPPLSLPIYTIYVSRATAHPQYYGMRVEAIALVGRLGRALVWGTKCSFRLAGILFNEMEGRLVSLVDMAAWANHSQLPWRASMRRPVRDCRATTVFFYVPALS